MKPVKIAINGFGRIGRQAGKIIFGRKNLTLVAINDLSDTRTLAHLLKHDTAYREFPLPVASGESELVVGKQKISVFAEKDPSLLPWKKLGIDVVIESTGRFTDKIGATKHLTAGAKRVVISAPGKDDEIQTLVCGVNADTDRGGGVIGNASCTTNCAAPVMMVMEKEFGVAKAMLTTIHSYTADQNLQDGAHKDLRRARAAAANMVPTSTGAAKAVICTIPSLAGKFDGLSIRVPTITVSLNDTTMVLNQSVTKDQVNAAFVKASKTYLKGILTVENEPLVSSDFIGNPYSAIVDTALTNVVAGNLVKVVAWYDNEWGYACRLIDMIETMTKK